MVETRPGVALVTGAARRIGRAIAEGLAADGWRVAVHHNASAEEADRVVAGIRAGGGEGVALAADLADADQVETLVPRTAAALGPPTLLVNNASIFEDDRIETMTRQSWRAHLAINLEAPAILIQAFARSLPEDARGNVVNLIDQRVWNLGPGYLSYTVSKAGLWTLTQTLAMALAPRIRVNAIGPGPTLPAKNQDETDFAAHCARLPLRRGTTPAEIYDAIRFILSAPAMTGQMIALDGGEHLGRPRARSATEV